jgi:hypothetical protein
MWSVYQADCLEWMRSLPTGCCSLAVTSPPFEQARTYSIGYSLAGQDWVDWMAPRVVEACRVTAGLVVVNMAGQVRDHRYSPVVEWLVADLTRKHGIVVGPAPYCYFRFGIPGSGGARYHRRDWEPVYAFCRPEVLPLAWSDNTAEGHPPKWAPGGEMSNRLKDGQRVGQSGAGARNGSRVLRTSNGKVRKAPQHTTIGPNGEVVCAAAEAALERVAALQREAKWAEARATLEQAEARLGDFGPAELRRRLGQARADLELVACLDAIPLERANMQGGRWDDPGADRKYAEAFAEARLGQVGDDEEAVAGRVADSPVREGLSARART